jgi:nucleotide-binding universal stress UspA family protein
MVISLGKSHLSMGMQNATGLAEEDPMLVRFRKILCPIDFFSASKRAFEYALKLAENYGASIELLHVVSPIVPSVYGSNISISDLTTEFQKEAAKQLQAFTTRVEKKQIPIHAEVVVGDVDSEIRGAISALKPDLVVVGTRGRRGFERWVLGSVTEKLMRHCPVPLLVIGSNGATRMVPPAIARMVVTTDFSSGTTDAMNYAFSIAGESQAKVTLLHVINEATASADNKSREPLLRNVRAELEKLVPEEARAWCDVKTQVETGTPWRVILKKIQAEKPGLLVMNVHGKGMLERALVGSTADRVLRGTCCPVLLIPPMKAGKARNSRIKRKAA